MAGNVHVILARDVPNLGRVGELVRVRPGYARNYLVPQGMALPASPKRVAEFAHKQRIVEHQRKKLRAASEARAQEMAKLQVTLTAKVGEQGKLFGSITSRDVADAISAEGFPVHHRDLKMETIKSIGLHVVDLRLEADVTTQVKVVVAAEQIAEENAAEAEDVADDAAEAEESVSDEAAES